MPPKRFADNRGNRIFVYPEFEPQSECTKEIASEVAKAVDEIQFRAEFKKRLFSQLLELIHSGASK